MAAELRSFRSGPPARDLGGMIRCRWDAVIDGHHDLIPDGCVELLWIADRGIWAAIASFPDLGGSHAGKRALGRPDRVSEAGGPIDGFLGFDLTIHSWDLARATGQDETIDSAEVERITAWTGQFGDALRTSGVCGPAVELPAGASAQEELLAFLGRDREVVRPTTLGSNCDARSPSEDSCCHTSRRAGRDGDRYASICQPSRAGRFARCVW